MATVNAGSHPSVMHPTLADRVRPPTFVSFRDSVAASESDEFSSTWYARSEYLLIAYREFRPSASTVFDSPNEHTVLFPDAETRAKLETAGERATVEGRGVVIAPPGRIVIKSEAPSRCVHISLLADAPEMADGTLNSSGYGGIDSYIAPLEPWPRPRDGFRLRSYQLSDYPVRSGVTGWMFRSTTHLLAWNYGHRGWTTRSGPDEYVGVGAHSHDDFEQVMLLLEGSLRVHTRVPWTLKPGDWVPDQHVEATSPALIALPPRVIHVADGDGIEIGIWCPPRRDWAPHVLNADDYPMQPSL